MDYFDTGNDPRIIFVEKALERTIKLASSRKIPGIKRNDLLQLLEELQKTVKKIRWSYLPKEELVKSEYFKKLHELNEKLYKFIEVNKLDEKDQIMWRLLRFLINNLKTLDFRILKFPDDPISAINYAYVKVLTVEKHPRAQRLFVAWVTDGKEKYEIVTNDASVKPKEILPLAFLPPREFMGIFSEGMFIGGDGIRRGTEADLGKLPKLTPTEIKKLKGEILNFLV